MLFLFTSNFERILRFLPNFRYLCNSLVVEKHARSYIDATQGYSKQQKPISLSTKDFIST
jgi:hypothetical protein